MRKAGPQQLNKIFHQGSLQKLQARSAELNKVGQAASQLFEQFGLTQVRMANIRNGVIVIEASSAPWANRLKQLRQNLLSELRQQLPSLVSIEIIINPSLGIADVSELPSLVSTNNAVSAKQNPLSKQAAMHITALATHAPKGLKEKLLKLASLADEEEQKTELKP